MCIRDRYQRRVRGTKKSHMATPVGAEQLRRFTPVAAPIQPGEQVWVNCMAHCDRDAWSLGCVEQVSDAVLKVKMPPDGEFADEFTLGEAARDMWAVVHGAMELRLHSAAAGECLQRIATSHDCSADMLLELNRKRYSDLTVTREIPEGALLLVPAVTIPASRHLADKPPVGTRSIPAAKNPGNQRKSGATQAAAASPALVRITREGAGVEVGDDLWVNFTDRWYRGRVDNIKSGHHGGYTVFFYEDREIGEYSLEEVVADMWPARHGGGLELDVHVAADSETLQDIALRLGCPVEMLVVINQKRYKDVVAQSELPKGCSLLVPKAGGCKRRADPGEVSSSPRKQAKSRSSGNDGFRPITEGGLREVDLDSVRPQPASVVGWGTAAEEPAELAAHSDLCLHKHGEVRCSAMGKLFEQPGFDKTQLSPLNTGYAQFETNRDYRCPAIWNFVHYLIRLSGSAAKACLLYTSPSPRDS
eukprot:TRINITY_DN28821_c0_g1_i1.p1 TRINITY_DN28821_c0_g1~~TRINITY_DN28821_c0_g1_i1.p1  ORF type:complete len:475 (-),score=75.04 TRINITY_DN28821_c0_g1_i1:50-1474(-)